MSRAWVNKVQPYDWSLGESLKPCVNSGPTPLNLFVFRAIGWKGIATSNFAILGMLFNFATIWSGIPCQTNLKTSPPMILKF